MERIEPELLRSDCPSFTNELEWTVTLQGLQPASAIVGVDEVGEVALELVVRVVAAALDGRFLERAHSFDCPFVQGCFGLVARCSMPSCAQAYSKA